MADPAVQTNESLRSKISDLSEDTLGYGGLELHTVWQLVRNPRAVLNAWMTAGPTGGGAFARPFRLYMGLNAILMLFLFLQGGAARRFLGGLPARLIDPLIAASGKSRDAFMGDADGWMSLTIVPILSLFYALATAILLRWWDPNALGWKRGFRAAFAYLCGWTVLMLPLAWWTTSPGIIGQIASAVMISLGIVTFMRMGAERWFESPLGGLGKALVLTAAIQFGAVLGFFPILAIALAAGRYF
jgi:hypothetical protein